MFPIHITSAQSHPGQQISTLLSNANMRVDMFSSVFSGKVFICETYCKLTNTGFVRQVCFFPACATESPLYLP